MNEWLGPAEALQASSAKAAEKLGSLDRAIERAHNTADHGIAHSAMATECSAMPSRPPAGDTQPSEADSGDGQHREKCSA